MPFNGGFKMEAKSSRSVNLDKNTVAGRIWARTGCSTENGRLVCDTGDCGAGSNNFGVECKGIGGQPPATLAEFTLSASGQDYYDISNGKLLLYSYIIHICQVVSHRSVIIHAQLHNAI